MTETDAVYNTAMRVRLELIHHKTICRAHAAGKIKLITNFETLNKSGSPVFNPWDNVLPLLGLIFLGLAILLFQGVIMGTVALVIVVAIFVVMVRPWIAAKLQKRTAEYMLADVENWRRIWKIGGVAMIRSDRPSLGCVAPEGKWPAFTRDFLDDYSKEPETEDMVDADSSGPQAVS